LANISLGRVTLGSEKKSLLLLKISYAVLAKISVITKARITINNTSPREIVV
jgi:hypothetical protein